MKLSIHTTVTDPEERQYPWREAIASYCDLADEIIIVDGSASNDVWDWCVAARNADVNSGKIVVVKVPWPEEYTQAEFPKHLNHGLELCTGDWAMKVDIDYIVHEKSIEKIRRKLEAWQDKLPFASYGKWTVLNKHTGKLKSKMPFIINRWLAPEVRYGIDAHGKFDDWSWPVRPTHSNDENIPIGEPLPGENHLRVDLFNYDCFFRTKDVQKYLFTRQARAFKTTGKASWGSTDEEAWQIFAKMMRDRLNNPHSVMLPEDHPKYIRDRVMNMTPDQFGFNNWDNNYD